MVIVEIYYQGTDITDMVRITTCVVRDTVGGRCDSLEIEFVNAAAWYSWGPEEDDKIVVAENGYDSGVMYVNRIIPENGTFRIYAASLPCIARKKEYKSFINQTLESIIRSCAASSGMDFQTFGINKKAVIPYIEREDETCAAFLQRLLALEGATLKCVNGKYTAIGIEYAQDADVVQTLNVSADMNGFRYRRDGSMVRSITVKSPFASATAEDLFVPNTHLRTVKSLPVRDGIQAGRWARGRILDHNRNCESVEVQSNYNPGLTAMMRINITGDTDATGEWLIESVEHDFVQKTSTALMRRCIRTIR